jgi:hypothetical protein
MAQPDHPAFERFAADQPKRLSRAWRFAVRSVIVDDARRSGYPIDSGMNQGAELVDQAVPEKGAVDDAAAFEKQLLHAEEARELSHGAGHIVPSRPSKDVRHAILAQLGEMGVRYLLAQHRYDVIATDVVLTIVDAP